MLFDVQVSAIRIPTDTGREAHLMRTVTVEATSYHDAPDVACAMLAKEYANPRVRITAHGCVPHEPEPVSDAAKAVVGHESAGPVIESRPRVNGRFAKAK